MTTLLTPKLFSVHLLFFLMFSLLTQETWAGKTLEAIKQKDQISCGVNTGLAGFGSADSQGKWTGLDVDICRAIASAVLGSADKVRFVPLSAPQRFTALQSGEIDILSRNTTFSLTRDASLGLNQTAVTFYDGPGQQAPQVTGFQLCTKAGGDPSGLFVLRAAAGGIG